MCEQQPDSPNVKQVVDIVTTAPERVKKAVSDSVLSLDDLAYYGASRCLKCHTDSSVGIETTLRASDRGTVVRCLPE